MKQGYFVTDDGMVAAQGMKSLGEAVGVAETIINDLPFRDIGRFEILIFDGVTSKTVRRFEAVVDWEML